MGKQPKTREQKERETDLRLQRVYGVGLDWYNSQFEKQSGGCKICGNPPKTRRLHIDHDHSYKYIKIHSKNTAEDGYVGIGWHAWADYNNSRYTGTGETKKEALATVRAQLKTASVRALLCHLCNRALILGKDDPALLRKMADYLENFQKGIK